MGLWLDAEISRDFEEAVKLRLDPNPALRMESNLSRQRPVPQLAPLIGQRHTGPQAINRTCPTSFRRFSIDSSFAQPKFATMTELHRNAP